ncbi:urea ABC transporter permease subunit UrtB [Bordetella genomosp. 4]|uniref:Urea ABC transporter permease subunit UrtB n=1 Tax=Bordetella genomosp. 4 TaxID=463044 RepID=A0A261V2I9_9BORD|nr:urea ABC transporter permease subunit UrtB [Bordetella genomosp. 4]OZI67822.1 urea ABC transporter permease subunit UrtB [Bordetella genomosp. 4]
MRCSAFFIRFLLGLVLVWMSGLWVPAASATGLDPALLAPLAGDDTDAKLEAITRLGTEASPQATVVLDALANDRLYVTPGAQLLVETSSGAVDAITGEPVSAMPAQAETVSVNNRLRRAIAAALSAARLHAADPAQRLAAARGLQRGADAAVLPTLEKALADEQNAEVKAALAIAVAALHLKSDTASLRIQAAETLGNTGNAAFRPVLQAVLQQEAQGVYAEPDAEVRAAATTALHRIERHLSMLEWIGNLFYGVSLGSVLLLAALGLAITFGLMGVINMAHGELLMIGAYVTYAVQALFRSWFPQWLDAYVIAAMPVAFVVTALVGMALERTVIRWLYGRPLETLLATWGISLMLMQAVRTLFGAQNVEVSNPSWMSGGVTVLGGLVLSYNRIAIIIFAILVVAFVWTLLNHTRLGLFVRAITQNRRMADCVGVPTGRVDMLAFGLGAGIAGLAGVALSQLGNVGPDLGRGYIVDSFMVVVLGGVGQLAGTVVAALGLGAVTKFLEPYSGAVMAKIVILVLIVLFVQKRPQGLFAPRGRSAD